MDTKQLAQKGCGSHWPAGKCPADSTAGVFPYFFRIEYPSHEGIFHQFQIYSTLIFLGELLKKPIWTQKNV